MTFPGSEVWTKIKCVLKTYVTEASSLYNNDVRCPECGTEIPNDQWRAETDVEGDIVLWQHMCSCGTLLRVFNE